MRLFTAIIMATILLASWHGAPQAQNHEEYILGPGDVIQIDVYDHAELSALARVDSEGRIRFPILGMVDTTGLSATTLADEIAARLGDGYIVNPEVSVFVKEYRSRKAIIMGEVKSPGLYKLSQRTTLLELVSQAGGFKDSVGSSAIIMHKAPDEDQSVDAVDLSALFERGDMTLDVVIKDGDSVYIQPAGVFYVSGEVKKPDSYKHKEGITVLQAITMAGGYTPLASRSKVRIIRKSGSQFTVMEKISMDALVEPDDVILVSEGLF